MTLSVFAAAREAPDAPAIVTSGRVISFAELAERVARVAGAIRDRASSRALVALTAGADLETLERLHALFALGVPALVVHPRLTARERRDLVERCSAALVLDDAFRLGAAARDVPDVHDDERPLVVVHTSGSSGQPKGVVLSRRAFAASARASAENLGWRDDDRWLLALPTAHVGGLSIVTRCLFARRPVVLAPPAPSFDPLALARLVEAERVTLLSLVPAQLARLLALEPAWRPPTHLRAVLLGGAAATPTLLARAAERGVPVLTTYGLTEACSQVTTERPDAPLPDHAARGAGFALPGIEVRVAGGAIEVRGPTLLSGYHPPDTGAPLSPDGWFRTGDLGELDAEGRLHVIGRSSDVIVTGGENVHPAEVERALESYPGVARACVFAVEDAIFGERVAAALVANGAAPSARELAAAIAERLAPFKRPRLVAWLGELPLTRTGKVDRKATARVATPLFEALKYKHEDGATGSST